MSKTKKLYYILGGILIVCLFIGISYALWTLSFNQKDTNMLASDCFQISFTEDTDAIQLLEAYPITDEEGKTLTPYTFTITNQCSSYASYQVNLEVLDSSTLSRYEAIKVELNEDTPVLLSSNEVVKTTLDNATTSFKLKTGYLDHNESVSYDLRLWIDENITIEDTDVMNTSFASKITITASYIDHMPSDYELCVEEYGEDSVQCSILADADNAEGCPTVNEDGTVRVTGREETNGYLCSAPDDYGTSYYYRGNVENNWVKFGGFYWRILRINGDGSIRMIYAGDASVIDALPNKSDVLKNGYNDGSTDYTQIGTSAYNSSYNNNAHVGYMYGENIWGEPETSETTSSRSLNDYYYYADSYTFDTATGRYTLTNPTQAVWSEELVGKYTCSSSTSTSCTTMYVIDEYRDSYRAYTYSYTRTSVEGGYEENHGTSRNTSTLANNYYYGTGYTFDKTTGQFRLTDYTRSVYDGSQVGKYTCASTSYSGCTTIYYVESEDTITTANVKTISRTGTTYEETHANITNSTIKGRVDTWYEEHILGTEYEQYIADTLFCNDRSFGSSNSGTGTGASYTQYRWNSSSNGIRLTCPNQNDRFTVDDEITGNGDLSYPIGLINTDEVYLAGGYGSNNYGYYLYTGNTYWTMSPRSFYGSYAYVRGVSSYGSANSGNIVNSSRGVRPTLNLIPDSLKVGSGTADDPYMIG